MRVSWFLGVLPGLDTAFLSTELLSVDSFLGGEGGAAVEVALVVVVGVAEVEGSGVVKLLPLTKVTLSCRLEFEWMSRDLVEVPLTSARAVLPQGYSTGVVSKVWSLFI